MSLPALPYNVQLMIVSHLSTAELLHFGLVSKDSYNLCQDEWLWNLLCVKTWRQLQLDDIENPESIGEISWKQAYTNISRAFPISISLTNIKSAGIIYCNVIIASNKFFPNITDAPAPPASFRSPIGWDDFHEVVQVHSEICKNPAKSSSGEEYQVDYALRIHGTSNDSYVGFSRRKEQRDLVEIVVVPLVEATDFRDLSEIEQPLVLLIPFEIFDNYLGRRLSKVNALDSPHTILELTQMLNRK
jgi:hypothetical protein